MTSLLCHLAQTSPVNAAEAMLSIRDLIVLLAGAVSLVMHFVQYNQARGDRQKVQALELRMSLVERSNQGSDEAIREMRKVLSKVDRRTTIIATKLGAREDNAADGQEIE